MDAGELVSDGKDGLESFALYLSLALKFYFIHITFYFHTESKT